MKKNMVGYCLGKLKMRELRCQWGQTCLPVEPFPNSLGIFLQLLLLVVGGKVIAAEKHLPEDVLECHDEAQETSRH